MQMKLYIGGACQGKLALACQENGMMPEAACNCEFCEKEDIFKAVLIYGLHHYIRRFIFTDEEKEELINRLKAENPGGILICDEVGCGVVPIDRREREYREYTGRVLTELAKAAGTVVRVYCGIGEKIK